MTSELTYCDWIAVDWGTSRLRAWAMQGDTVRAEARSDKGMSQLSRDGFEDALLELIDGWLGAGEMPVIACGMVGSREGWVEAPYRAVPCLPVTGEPIPVMTADRRLRVSVLPGLKQDSPPDVMRGEETQIAGFLAQTPGFDGVLCLPGTHTKWVQISAGEVVSFRTFMTGELFALISTHSVLRHSLGEGWDGAAFKLAAEDALARPEQVAARLFGLRADALLNNASPDVARARLSGLLIGLELAGTRAYWLGQRLAVIGNPETTAAYAAALQTQGAPVETAEADAMTRLGLSAARGALKMAAQ